MLSVGRGARAALGDAGQFLAGRRDDLGAGGGWQDERGGREQYARQPSRVPGDHAIPAPFTHAQGTRPELSARPHALNLVKPNFT